MISMELTDSLCSRFGFVKDGRLGGEVDAISAVEYVPLNAIALADEAIHTVGILDDPGPI